MKVEAEAALARLASGRLRVALTLTAVMMAVYFGFILLVAFAKPIMATQLVPGLSLGIALGAATILFAFVITLVYVRWANTHLDAQADSIVKEFG
jgi:uncharacterized membrane protein (DUF485 family)